MATSTSAIDPRNPLSLNRFGYVQGDPINFNDPTGEERVAVGTICFFVDGQLDSCDTVYGDNSNTGGLLTSNGGINVAIGGGGVRPAPAPLTKQQCIDNFLKDNYGTFLGGTVAPDFSLISIVTHFSGFLKSSAVSMSVKGLAVILPNALGRLATITGNNLAAYPGMAAASADALEAAAFWATTATTAEMLIAPLAVAATTFSTTADALARWECRNVP